MVNRKRYSIIYKIDEEEFKNIIRNSANYSEAIRKCGYNNTGNTRILKERIKELKLDTSHFIKNDNHKRTYTRKSNSEIFTENSKSSRSCVKKRLYEHYGWEHKCNSCGLSEWTSRTTGNKPVPIKLELEHKNGKNDDNRIENLELLCCLCHSYTSTWRSNNIKITKNKCLDCSTIIRTNSKRCLKCHLKILHKNNKEYKIKQDNCII